jgi:gluconolactonase
VRALAEGIGFTEGPLWIDGRLLVTSVSRGLIYEVSLDGGAEVVAETGGGPNGLAADADGRVWVAQNAGATGVSKSQRAVAPGLQRLGDGGVEDVLTEGCDAPNDLVEGPDGRIWFTDPHGPFDDKPGTVRAYDPRTGALETVLDGLEYPNGLVFAGDDLLLAETRTRRILRSALDGTPPRELAPLPDGRPDGMALGADGNLYVAATSADAVFAFDLDGRERGVVQFDGPTMPTNVAFAGELLVVTAGKGGRVLAVEGVTSGAPA